MQIKKTTIWILILMICSCSTKKRITHDDSFIEFIVYEYGMPLQNTLTGFDIRISLKIDDKGNTEQIFNKPDGSVSIPTKLSKELLNELKALDIDKSGIKKHIIEEERNKSINYAGAYHYMKFNGNEICYIPPFMSEQFNAVMDKLRKEIIKSINLVGRSIEIDKQNFKKKIIPIHELSNLPIIRLPPPPPPPGG